MSLVDEIKAVRWEGAAPKEAKVLYGHPFFYQQTTEEAALHSRKNFDYAQGGNPLGNFQRVAAILALYPDLPHADPAVVALTYALKQLDATLWMLNRGHASVTGEGLHERLQDISVYCKITRCILKDQEEKRAADNHDAARRSVEAPGVRDGADAERLGVER